MFGWAGLNIWIADGQVLRPHCVIEVAKELQHRQIEGGKEIATEKARARPGRRNSRYTGLAQDCLAPHAKLKWRASPSKGPNALSLRRETPNRCVGGRFRALPQTSLSAYYALPSEGL